MAVDQRNAQWQEAGVDVDEEAGAAVRSDTHAASSHRPALTQESAFNAGASLELSRAAFAACFILVLCALSVVEGGLTQASETYFRNI